MRVVMVTEVVATVAPVPVQMLVAVVELARLKELVSVPAALVLLPPEQALVRPLERALAAPVFQFPVSQFSISLPLFYLPL